MACSFFRKQPNIFHVAIDLGVIHAVTDHEVVGDLEGNVVRVDGNEAAIGLIEAGRDLQGGRFVLEHEAAEIAQRKAGIEDIFDQDHVLALDRIIDVLDQFYGARGDARAAVGADCHKVEGRVDLDGASEVREKDRRTFKDADEHDGPTSVVLRDLCAQGRDAVGNLLP